MPERCENHAWGFVTTRCVGCVAFATLRSLRSLCRDRYIQSATNRAVALRWLRSLRSDRYIHIGCVALHALRSVRCFRVFGSRRYVPNGCVASVAFVPFTSFRSERNDVNARNVSHRLRWLASVRCKPFIHQPHQPVSVKDCQKKLNFFFRHHKNFHQKKKKNFFLGVGDFGKKNPKKKIQKKPSQTVQ